MSFDLFDVLIEEVPFHRIQALCSVANATNTMVGESKAIIPLLDLAKYHSDRRAFVEELREACHLVGFFLVRHDFQDVADTILSEARQFFQRPLEQKQQISYYNCPSFRGYMPLGVENTAGKVDSREQIEWAVEYPRPGKQWPLYERLKATQNPWPNECQPKLQSTTQLFAKEVCNVADCIRDALCLALELDDNQKLEFLSRFEAREDINEIPHWVIKLISYPPMGGGEAQQGVGAHTDTNFLTLVLQDSVGGLQAFSKGEWIDVPTEYGSSVLVCNLGEQAQILSRGYLLATPHRVLANTTSTNPRISVPLFYNPVLSATIEPISKATVESLRWDRPRDYKNWERTDNAMLKSVGENTFKSLARSHPDVFRNHHKDLEILKDGHIEKRS